jgi:glutathione S-transferase
MKLYYSESLNPRKACAVARHVRAPVEFVIVDLGGGEQRTAAFQRLNPNSKVPVLAEGGRTLWEANAIMCRLAQLADHPIWPSDERQADIIRWLGWDSANFSLHGGTLYFENLIRPNIGLGPPDAAQVRKATEGFRCAAAVLDEHLASSRWAVGHAPTIADFALGASLPYAVEARIPLSEFSNVERWYAALNELPGWSDPFPSRAIVANESQTS